MKLDENFTITNDSNQWVLEFKKEGEINPKTDKPKVTSNKWYCANLKSALIRYCDEALKPCESVLELTTKVIELQELIKNR